MNAVCVCRWWHRTKAGEEYRSFRLSVAGVVFYAIDVPLADAIEATKALAARGVVVTTDPPGNDAEGFVLPPELEKPEPAPAAKPVKAAKVKPISGKPVAADDALDF